MQGYTSVPMSAGPACPPSAADGRITVALVLVSRSGERPWTPARHRPTRGRQPGGILRAPPERRSDRFPLGPARAPGALYWYDERSAQRPASDDSWMILRPAPLGRSGELSQRPKRMVTTWLVQPGYASPPPKHSGDWFRWLAGESPLEVKFAGRWASCPWLCRFIPRSIRILYRCTTRVAICIRKPLIAHVSLGYQGRTCQESMMASCLCGGLARRK